MSVTSLLHRADGTARRKALWMLPVALLAALVLVGPGLTTSAHGASAKTTGTICKAPTPCEVSYYDPPSSKWATSDQTLCKKNAQGDCIDINLKGWLYLPGDGDLSAASNLPLVVSMHGSGTAVPKSTEIGKFFTAKGYAFFIPGRRGHGSSTGTNLDVPCTNCTAAQRDHLDMVNFGKQVLEVNMAFLNMLARKNSSHTPIVNPNRVGLMGHSYGGILSLFANAALDTQQATLEIAGASESWTRYDGEDGHIDDTSPTINVLRAKVHGAKRPLFFFEPKNDVSTRPTVIFSKKAGDDLERYQASLYGPVPLASGEDTHDAHVKFVTDAAQVAKWGPAAVEWLRRFGV